MREGSFESQRSREVKVMSPVLAPEYSPTGSELLDPQNYINALKKGREVISDLLKTV